MNQIRLSQGQVALVDDDDYAALAAFRWCAKWYPNAQTFYAVRSVREGTRRGDVRTVRRLCILTGWAMVDHIDHNGLNNQRANLREASFVQNNRNRRSCIGGSRFKGVSPYPRGKWRGKITVDSRQLHLGIFATEMEAARAYNQAATEHFGKFAHLNDLPTG